MEEDLHSFGEKLKSFVERNNPSEAEIFIKQIEKTLTSSECSPFALDTYFLNIFNKSTGLLSFLKQIIYKNEFKKVKIYCFELLYTIVNNFHRKIGKHLLEIIRTCAPVVRSSATAAEKEKSLTLIALVLKMGNLRKDCIENVDNEMSVLYKDTLFNCLYQRFDKSPQVQEHLLIAIGLVAKMFPSVIENSEQLCTMIISQLSIELQLQDKSLLVVHGSFSALSNLFENFPCHLVNDKEVVSKLYKCVKLMANPQDAHRRTAFRENLSFLSKHITLFSDLLYLDAEWWHQTFLKWFSLGVEDKKAVFGILESFTQEMAKILTTKNDKYDQDLFKYIMNYFNKIILESSADNYEMQYAICGLGQLAKSFKLHISSAEISRLFVTMSQFLEDKYIFNTKIDQFQLSYLPHYVRSLACIISNLPELHSNHIVSLQLISILLIKIFPQLSTTQHHIVVDAFVIMLHQLTMCSGNLLQLFLEKVVHQGVLWTCSHPIVSDAEILKEEIEDIVTYKKHLPLWTGLLNVLHMNKYEKFEINFRQRKVIIRTLINELITTLFLILNKINLNTKLIDENNPVTDPAAAYEPIQTNDFVVFVNIVDFYQDILDKMNVDMFKCWIIKFINFVLSQSLKYPLVSGFYKLLTSCLRNCEKLDYFIESNLANEQVQIIHHTLIRYTDDILWKVKHYKGDLQIACLRVIAAMPISVIREVLPLISPAFIVLFSIGRSYLELASLGIDVLEKWIKQLPFNEIEPILIQVLPSLDSYLKSRSLGGSFESNPTFKYRKTKERISRRKILVQTEPELLKLQIKIISFIGQLNNNLCMAFVNNENNEQVIWNKTSYLKVIFPYNTKLLMHMDHFIPRVLELALYSSDRKINIAACELLHAFILIILGTSKSMNDESLKGLDCLVRAVAYPVLKLGCDMDEIVQKLFSTLSIQLMHYYSHPAQMRISHTQIIIEALMDGVTNSTDSSLRDFSGKCIHEFVKWTIKQANKDDLLGDPINIKIWIRCIQSFSTHPDSFKRLGAALIFNNIYKLLREETHMFNMFWLELLHTFVVNLSLTQVKNVDDNNCVDQVLQALNHLQRGFVEKKNIFNEKNKNRRKPPDFDDVLLKDVAKWLLKQTSSLNVHCRTKCISMFCKIAPLVKECDNSLPNYNNLYCITDPEWISNTYEVELIKVPTLNNLTDLSSTDDFFKWFQSLLCALDGYHFVVNNNLLPIDFVSETSKFLIAINYFLDHVMVNTLDEVIKKTGNINFMFTSAEKGHFKDLKANVVTKLMSLLELLLKNKVDLLYAKIEIDLFWEHHVENVIRCPLFDPLSIGFNFANDNKGIINFLNTICDYASNKIILSITQSIYNYINQFSTKFTLSTSPVSFKERQLLKGLLLLHETYLSDKLDLRFFNVGVVLAIKEELIENRDDKSYIKKIHPTAKEFCDLKLQLALHDEKEFLVAVRFIFEKTLIINEEKATEITFSSYFYEAFKDVLLKFLIENYTMVLDEIISHINEESFAYIFDVLKYARQNSNSLQNQTEMIVKTSLNKWDVIVPYFNENLKNRLTGLDFLSRLASVSAVPLCDLLQEKLLIVEWVIALLSYQEFDWSEESSLSFKSEVINILPCVLGKYDVFSEKLSDDFETIKKKYYDSNTSKNKQFSSVTTFRKLLDAVKYSKSTVLLQSALDIFASVPYINEDVQLTSTLKYFIRYISTDRQVDALELIYKMCFSTNKFSYFQRLILAKNVIPILLQFCYYGAFEKFYTSHVKLIKTEVEKKIQDYDTSEIVNRMINFILIERLFLRIKIDGFVDNTCPISKAAFPNVPPASKKMLKFFTGIMLETMKESGQGQSQEDKNMFRCYQCYAYNSLISLISNTQTSLDFYNALFSRPFIWKNIIDVDRKYHFEIVFESVPSLRKVLSSIRSEMLDKRRKTDPNARTVNYIESQHLFKSTLNEDITKFDFTHSVIRSQPDERVEIKNIELTEEMEITLEEVHINLHECMAPICGVIEHMVYSDISPLPLENAEVGLPKWMEIIRNILMDDTNHNNIRIFFAKVVHNCQHIFKHYAKFFYAPILKFITDGVVGNTINFFVTDLVVMLMKTWSTTVLPMEDRALATSLLKFLMSNCDNEIRSIFKYNLEQIKLVIESWKDCLDIPYEVIYAKLQLPEMSQKLEIGIQLAATVLANNLAPWSETNLKNFLMTVSKILKSTRRSVYQPCAEVLGMALNFITHNADYYRHLEQFRGFVYKQLEKLSFEENKFGYCLLSLSLHYPAIADKYLVKLSSRLKLVPSTFKNVYLKIFLARLDELHATNELLNIDFRSLLVDEDLETQLLTLEIIQKAILHLKTHLLPILKEVSNFINSSSTHCRSVMYDIFISVYNAFFLKQYPLAQEVLDFSEDILLQGLIDKESSIQNKLFQFWASNEHLHKDIAHVFLYLLNTMYKPSLEENYVCYSAYFLLNRLKETEEYSEKLFRYPLRNCDFEDYQLISNWRRQHVSMAPLFASSLSSQDTSLGVMNPNVLRATVSTLEFQPTQMLSSTSKSLVSPSTSLLFNLNEEDENKIDETFKNPNQVLQKIRGPRFIKDKAKLSRYFADEEVKKSLQKETLRKERIQKSEKDVNISRNYRIGEIPDIEITLSCLINPLQILVSCDATLARHLYTSLFISLVNKMKEAKLENRQFNEAVTESIDRVLKNSTHYVPNTIGNFLDIALAYKDQIQFDPAVIVNVCKESGLLSLGSLLLEEYVQMRGDEPTPAKKMRGCETEETSCWVKLAELYKEMNEWDVVTAVFMEKMKCSEIVLKAIEAESTGHWRSAQEFYYDVIKEDTSPERRDFYYESYFKSFAALGEWDKLCTVITDNVCTDEQNNVWTLLWDDDWNQNKLLPWYITASLRNTLSGANQTIFESINELLRDPEKSEYLKNNFGEELAMLCVLQNDPDTAGYYVSNTVTSWLENWAHLNPLFLKLRANTLFSLKGVVDIQMFINFISSLSSDNHESKVNKFLKSWTNAVDSLESVLQAEKTIVYRLQFITSIQQKLSTLTADEEFINSLKRKKFTLHLNLTEHALKQSNYFVARKHVKLAGTSKALTGFENLQWPLAVSKVLFLLSQTLENSEEKISYLMKSWSQLGTPQNYSYTNDTILCYIVKTKQHVYELTQNIHAVLSTHPELYDSNQEQLKQIIGDGSLSNVDQIWLHGVHELKNALDYCGNEIQIIMNSDYLHVYSQMAEAYVKLAYCVQYKENMYETFIVCVLRAMKLGSIEGKQLFPCLLNEKTLQFRNTFKLECSEIPTWMFLKWIPQLLANLDTNCIFVIDNIVLELAKTYPQSIIFPYRISREKYKFETYDIENVGRELMRKLDDILPGDLIEELIKSIGSVCPPTKVLSYYLGKLYNCKTEEEFKCMFQTLLDSVYPEEEKLVDYRDPKSIKGPMFKEIAGFEAKLKALLKGNFNLNVAKDKVLAMRNELPHLKSKRSTRLADYSPWLANFQDCRLRENLEIPGQYTGEKRPLVQYHTRITGFAQSVCLLSSVRAPIKITILGNDAKEYNYLVKFGEDLRLDQRIQQLFTLMNNVLLQDNNCNTRQMNIVTYQVVPLSSNVGIIEWLNDTEKLIEFLERGLSDSKSLSRCQYMYVTWMNKIIPKKLSNPSVAQRYACATKLYKDKDFIGKFTELVNCVEPDVLRKAFWSISLNSEIFFALRQKFIVSYAVICISHWLLGIGDRHLENTLMSLRNGGAISIDFGHAFGVGTQILQVPELVPFRLTPHILHLMLPLGEHGLLQETMIHCLRAFRKRSDILLATMNVFIQEPSIDWIEFARISEISKDSTVEENWYPIQKIDHAKRKLGGVNPVNILIEELIAGHSRNPEVRDIHIGAVKGKEHNFRARVNDNLNEEQQVKCLLDLATDYNVLGRMYEGWQAWV